MSKKRKGRHQRTGSTGGRTTPKGTRSGGVRRLSFDHGGSEGPSRSDPLRLPDPAGWDGGLVGDLGVDLGAEGRRMMADVREALAFGEPIALLMLASGILDVFDPRNDHPFQRRSESDRPLLGELVDTLLQMEHLEVTGLLAAFGVLASDQLIRRRIGRALTPAQLNRPGLPAWLADLPGASVTRVVEQSHVLGDGEDLLLGVTVGRHQLTAVVYVDHNLGTAVKDAFVVPGPVQGTVDALQRAGAVGRDYAYRDLDPAETRAKLTKAIDLGARIVPPIESDTWPECRPAIEWITRLLPEGGQGYQRPEWSDQATRALTEAFFASPEGAPLDDPHHRDLLESVLWFATGYGPGDPLRWSEVSVEILLLDWVPRKIVADAEHLTPIPDLLRAFIRYCHRERAIPGDLTDGVLRAVDHFEPAYQDAIRSDRPQGPAALIQAMGLAGGGGFGDDLVGLESELIELFDDPVTRYRRSLEDQAGGPEALAALDDDPLPDEAFDWSGIDDDVRERVAEVLDLLDGFAEQHLGVEFRTATRRLLANIARHGSEVFRRRGAASSAAAAIAWVVARDNGLLNPGDGGLYAKDLLAAFGRSGSVSQRASTLLRNAGLSSYGDDFRCGPDLLTSASRAHLISQRDNLPALEAALRGEPTAALSNTSAPSRRRPSKPVRPSGNVHVLKVTIEETMPPVWRRLVVPSDATFGELHDVLQVAFAWEDSHLHAFDVEDARFEPGDAVAANFGMLDHESMDEDEATLAEMLEEGDVVTYTYDFGDDWRHRIEVEAVDPDSTGDARPTCLDGRRAAPPEDVGGPFGFMSFLRAMADPDHPEHADLVSWHGGRFDPSAVSVEDIDAALRRALRDGEIR